jgi:hypothetical protein
MWVSRFLETKHADDDSAFYILYMTGHVRRIHLFGLVTNYKEFFSRKLAFFFSTNLAVFPEMVPSRKYIGNLF